MVEVNLRDLDRLQCQYLHEVLHHHEIPKQKINMDGEDEEINIDDIVIQESSDEESVHENDSDDEQLFLNGWLLLNRESAEQEQGSVVI